VTTRFRTIAGAERCIRQLRKHLDAREQVLQRLLAENVKLKEDLSTMRHTLTLTERMYEEKGTTDQPPESEYAKAIRTDEMPAIWPPISMTAEELQHFRQTHVIDQ